MGTAGSSVPQANGLRATHANRPILQILCALFLTKSREGFSVTVPVCGKQNSFPRYVRGRSNPDSRLLRLRIWCDYPDIQRNYFPVRLAIMRARIAYRSSFQAGDTFLRHWRRTSAYYALLSKSSIVANTAGLSRLSRPKLSAG